MEQETCWTMIRAVRAGDGTAREEFARRYASPVRAYLEARWRGGPLASEAEDAAQEVFARCFAEPGPLDRLAPSADGGFHGFLYGICRNVAREQERSRHPRPGGLDQPDEHEADEPRLSTAFDRAFARQVVCEARERFRRRALAADDAARRRIELLGLRFEQNLPIRTIAQRWQADAATLHKEYARARREFRQALLEVVAEQDPGRRPAEVERAAKGLLDLLA